MKRFGANVKFHGHKILYCRVRIRQEHLMIVYPCPSGSRDSVPLFVRNHLETKNLMLEYLSYLMEDSHDFGWQAAKGAHAVLLCKMEENKVNWCDTTKIDRVRRVHAQRVSTEGKKKTMSKDKAVPCRYYQKGTCGQSSDHENNGQKYLHVCVLRFSFGKSSIHPQKECKHAKNE